ncbi:MAG: T9SS type A sorting domain-containing protein [Bacteroidia bacterium]
MKQIYTSIILGLCLAFSAQAQQFTYDVEAMTPVARQGVTNMSAPSSFGPHVTRIAPAPGGEAAQSELAKAKEIVARRFPRRDGSRQNVSRAVADQPSLRTRFNGPNTTLGIPMDTHLAVSNDGQVVGVINFSVAVYDTLGNELSRQYLQDFFQPISPISTIFDPKVHYDPDEDRFILIALARTETASDIYFGFSQTNDATGAWNLYKVEGDPRSTGTFFDYPMASLSPDELFLTGNSVTRGVSWQLGFVETLIYQIDKQTGYNGDPLVLNVWSNLSMLGSYLRNLCPVKGATGNYGPNHYFLSNRNFDVQNDTIIMIQIEDTLGPSLPFIDMQLFKSSQAYGAPPEAQQLSNNTLATNDARILDAFIFNNRIQFVGNTVDTANGKAAIYYGIVDDVAGSPQLSGQIIGSDTLEFGYPSIAYTGSGNVQDDEQDAVIFCDYTEAGEYPGTGAFYMDVNGDISDFAIAKEGENLINVLTSLSERWGDYTGCQRKYNSPGEVWTMGTFGLANGTQRIANPHVSQWLKPSLTVSNTPALPATKVSVYPNPAQSRVQLDFVIERGQKVEISLFDVQGRQVEQFFSYPVDRSGEHRFTFDATPLPAGVYMISITADGAKLASKRLVVK